MLFCVAGKRAFIIVVMSESSDATKLSGGAEILLPDESWMLKEWKCTEGSLVRKGETVALACPKDSSQSDLPLSTEPSSTSHKRPTRRRRIAPAGTAVSHHETSTSPRATDSFTNIQQRLVAKLSSEKPTTDAASPPGLATSPSTVTDTSPRIEGNTTTKKGVSARPILAPSTGILRKSLASTECNTTGSDRIIGFVDACMHPAFLEGICVVCGASMLQVKNDEHEMNERIPK